MNNSLPNNKYDQIFAGLPLDFTKHALELFNYQYAHNTLYHDFSNCFGAGEKKIIKLEEIPFLPVSFFKSHPIQTNHFQPQVVFESSGTTGMDPARHYVRDIELYRESFVKGFRFFYGDPADYCILGLLPSYLERSGSSLVFMVDELIRMSGQKESGFYLYDFDSLNEVLLKLEKRKQKTILIGVSFALLDFSERVSLNLKHTLVMETGGMKGRREEITRLEMHEKLKQSFGVEQIHSEYGMTELLSQAYSKGAGIYKMVPWMKAMVRDEDDPLLLKEYGEGLLNVIDLANRDSCAFIATDDVVRLSANGEFEILGRMDHSDMRGCSLLAV